jgi:hypothetical protein
MFLPLIWRIFVQPNGNNVLARVHFDVVLCDGHLGGKPPQLWVSRVPDQQGCVFQPVEPVAVQHNMGVHAGFHPEAHTGALEHGVSAKVEVQEGRVRILTGEHFHCRVVLVVQEFDPAHENLEKVSKFDGEISEVLQASVKLVLSSSKFMDKNVENGCK